MGESYGRSLKQFPSLYSTDGYTILPDSFFDFIRIDRIPTGPALLATLYLRFERQKGSGVVKCSDLTAARDLGRSRRTIQSWKSTLVEEGCIKTIRGSNRIDIRPMKDRITELGIIKRTQKPAHLLGEHAQEPAHLCQHTQESAHLSEEAVTAEPKPAHLSDQHMQNPADLLDKHAQEPAHIVLENTNTCITDSSEESEENNYIPQSVSARKLQEKFAYKARKPAQGNKEKINR